MQRGEIQGACAYMVSALKSSFSGPYNAGDLVPILQFARKSEELAAKGVPYMLDLARTDEEKRIFNLIYTRDVIGRPIVAPANLPADRTAMLRSAFDATMKDAETIEAVKKSGLPLTPMSGAEVEKFVNDYVGVPPEVLARARSILEVGAGEQLQKK